ncbi:MAG: sodium ion-translocating decarboxylase subunit beta [Clostridiaceae bacterium]|nr:sodium ion-translocating decarboxylase subunit beta [Clostridiaceae bacterium]
MNVYFNANFHDREKGIRGKPQHTEYRFEYGGYDRYIPVIYRFPAGIVFDVITVLDPSKPHTEQGGTYPYLRIKEAGINGNPAGPSISSAFRVFMPDENNKTGQDLKKAYNRILRDNALFSCERFCVSYKASLFRKMMRFIKPEKIKRLQIAVVPHEVIYPLDIRFSLRKWEEKSVDFVHPGTKKKHRIFIKDLEQMNIPLTENGESVSFFRAFYGVEPSLSEKEVLLFNNRYEPNGAFPYDKYDKASAIGIIGGADGPVSVFVSTKRKENRNGIKEESRLKECFSMFSSEPKDSASFHIDGLLRLETDERIYDFP